MVGRIPTKVTRTAGALVAMAIAFAQPAASQDLVAECRRLAGSPDEPNNPDKIGVAMHAIDSVRAVETCTAARDALGYEAMAIDPVAAYRLSRAYMAIGPRQDLLQSLYLQRIVWAGGKRSAGRLGTKAVAWYAKVGQNNLTPATYEKAANEGSVSAQMILAFLHAYPNLHTLYGKRDLDSAINWMRMAADQDYPPALHWYGVMLGWKNEHDAAFQWLQRAAERNWKPAFYSLGIAYAYGQGTKQNAKRGLEFLGKAANAGNVDAHIAIGHLFLKGTGVKQDPRLARRWYKKAADIGSQEAVNLLKQTENHGDYSDQAALALLATLGILFLLDSSGADNSSTNSSSTEKSQSCWPCAHGETEVQFNQCLNLSTGALSNRICFPN